jgi:hypothetical protein
MCDEGKRGQSAAAGVASNGKEKRVRRERESEQRKVAAVASISKERRATERK